MRILLFSLLALLFLSAHSPQGKDRLEWMIGEWEGIGYQVNTNETWNTQLSFKSIDDPVAINYPGLACSGYWKLSEFKDRRAVFIEDIQKGVDKCMQGVKVIVTYVNEQHISVAYCHDASLPEVGAFAVLKKK